MASSEQANESTRHSEKTRCNCRRSVPAHHHANALQALFFISLLTASVLVLSSCGVISLDGLTPQNSQNSAASQTASANSVTVKGEVFEPATILWIVDGDTLEIRTDSGEKTKVRLIGINAPESVASDQSRNCEEGVEASDYMKTLVAKGDTIWLQRDTSDTDQYGRLLRYVWVEVPDDPFSYDEVRDKMLDGMMVYAGYAQARDYRPDTNYSDILSALGYDAEDDNRGVSYYWTRENAA